MGFLDHFLNRGRQNKDARASVVSTDTGERLKLARSPRTPPELLYYLAQHDPDAGVRLAVANNKATPVHASSVIASDRDVDVRLALGNRLVKLLPNLSKDKQGQLYSFAVQALGTLAIDEVLKIRIALSSALKDHAHAPPQVVGQLARDIEREVSEPILKFCLALSDEDLLDILKTHPGGWALQAIAGRKNVSETLSRAVIDAASEEAGVALLENSGALISADTLRTVVDKSKTLKKWQKPIAIRKNLPAELAKQLAEFVDDAVRTLLMERTDFDRQTLGEIGQIIKRRLDLMDNVETKKIAPADRVKQMVRDKTLNEESLSDALAIQDKELASTILAAMARATVPAVEKIMSLNAPKPVIALSWKAGISMRMCLRLQREMAYVPVKEQIMPKGGTDYPLEESEIKWQIDFLGL